MTGAAIVGTCSRCGAQGTGQLRGSVVVFGGCRCPPPAERKASKFSRARKTRCSDGHVHASGNEARVCEVLTADVGAARLLQQVRLPLFSGRQANGKVLYASIDFVVTAHGRPSRFIDAKNKGLVSREFRRGAALLEASYGIRVETMEVAP